MPGRNLVLPNSWPELPASPTNLKPLVSTLQVTAWLVVYLPIWKILVFRLLKSFRMPFLANNFFMIYLWFEYDFHLWFFYGFKLWLWFFYGLDMVFLWFWIFFWFAYDFLWFWIWFFYDFFDGFLVLRIWFSAKNARNFRFFYDFARVSFSPKPFQQKIWFWKQKRKKIVNASKVPRIWFSAIKTREIFDFFMILLEFL